MVTIKLKDKTPKQSPNIFKKGNYVKSSEPHMIVLVTDTTDLSEQFTGVMIRGKEGSGYFSRLHPKHLFTQYVGTIEITVN